ncbi:MAG: alpha/beta hydrolase [Chloroflexota bacterium]
MAQAYDAALRRLTVPYDHFVVETRFGVTHGLVAGPADASPVVLLHGWNTSAPGWWPQINALAHVHRIYAPDTIGQGGRSAPTRPSTRGPAYGQWLADVAQQLGLSPVDWIGSSGGAWLIFKLAEESPSRIRSASLISPAGLTSVRLAFLLRAAAAGLLFPTSSTPARFARLVSPPPLPLDEEHILHDAPLLLHLRSQPPPPTLPDRTLHRLSGPTLLLVGEHEVVFDRRRLIARAQRHIPGLMQVEVVTNAGHDLTYNQPEAVNARLLGFLDQVSAAAPPCR